MRKTPSSQELLVYLDEQLDFIHNSATLYDQGMTHEAKRLALGIRVLINDTRNQKSLLAQLKVKDDLDFFSILQPIILEPNISWAFGFNIRFTPDGVCFSPVLKEPTYKLGFLDWWNRIILKNQEQLVLVKDIVLEVADREGGAHIDDKGLSELYYKFSKENEIGIDISKYIPSNPMNPGFAFPVIRQVAHELEYSLRTQMNVIEKINKRPYRHH